MTNPLPLRLELQAQRYAFGCRCDSDEPVGVPLFQMLHGHCSMGVVTVAELDGVLALPAAS